MTRYFIGLTVPGALAAAITDIRRRLGAAGQAAIRRCEPHLTLVVPFTTDESVSAIVTKLQITLRECNLLRFDLTTTEIGAFGQRTWYLGLDPSEPLSELQRTLWNAVADDPNYHLVRTDYEFRPHITIVGRLTEQAFNDGHAIVATASIPPTTWTVDAITLYRHTGEHWESVQRIPFSS